MLWVLSHPDANATERGSLDDANSRFGVDFLSVKLHFWQCVLPAVLLLGGCQRNSPEAIKAELESLKACEELLRDGLRPIATSRDQRFAAKVQLATAVCRGGETAAR